MDDNTRHLESIRRSLVLLALISAFVTVYFARDLLLPVMLGLLIALTLSPVTRALQRAGVPYAVSAVALVGALGAAILGLLYLSAGVVGLWMQDARTIGTELEQKLRGVAQQVESVREASEEVAELTKDADAAQEVLVQQPTLFDSAFSVISQFGASLVVALVLAIFLLGSGDMFYTKLVQSFRSMSDKKRALNMVYDIERKVSHYLLTIAVINACLGICVGVAMTLLGLEYGYVWGVAAFLLNFLPYLGGVIGATLVGVSAIVMFDSLGYALLAPLIYFVLTSIEGQFITPWAVGRQLELNTVAVFLTVVLWGWLWGIPGALFAVPFLVVIKVICDNIDSLRVFGNFLGRAGPVSETVKAVEDAA